MSNEFDIAIVGMSGRFPGARNLDEFWHNLAGGVESITRFSERDLLESGVPASHLANSAYVRAAPVLEAPGHFDAAFFGLSPREAATMDPQHRLLLELAHEALEHAGCDPDRYQGRTGVFTGSALNTYFTSAGLNGRLAEDYIPTLIGNDKDFLSTRISYKLNLKGPSITIQTACSTSMVAVHLARQSLLSNETDMALAGAVSVRVPHRAGYFYDGGGVVSPDGHVRAFDAAANGTVFGSGGGILVLKRLADALADGDTLHALIKGSAVNNDGSGKAGYTAPSVDGQADAVMEALANAGVDADAISYVEAHGSGTPVGDPIEIAALTKAFRASTQRAGYCAIGSVKTNVGHLDAAAAVAGIIKTVLALRHRKLPPSLHFTQPNPEIDFASTPFYVNARLQEWTSAGPRRAGVMSTGMGGTNAHLVLEEAPHPGAATAAGGPQLLMLSAKTETALDQATHRLREFLGRSDSPGLGDVAYTLQAGRKAFSHRRCVVCTGREDAIAALGGEDAKRLLAGRPDEAKRPLILLLPGVGDHYVGMARELYETWPVFKQEIDRCAQILQPTMGIDIRNVIYPIGRGWKQERRTGGIDLKKMLGRGGDTAEDEDTRKLNRTLFTQPALFTIEYAMARLWRSLGIAPDAIVGHSMGEYVAACLAGVLSLEDALWLVAMRARMVNELPQGAMLAVTLPEGDLRPLLPADLSISLINGPGLCVVAGPATTVAAFEKTLKARGIISRRVQNAHAFHSRMLDPIANLLEGKVKKVRLREPTIPYISNVSGTWITPAEATDPAYWVRHAINTARFDDALRELWRFKNPILLEAGPGRTLGVLAMQHPDRRGAADPVAVASIRHHYENRSDGECLWEGIGRLWLAGAAIKWENAPHGARRRVPLPTYPFEGQLHWLEPARAAGAAPDASAPIRKNPDPSRWLYVPSWKRLLPRVVSPRDMSLRQEEPRKWLVYADDCGLAPVLIARLRSAGHDVVCVRAGSGFRRLDARSFTIDPASFQDHDALIRALQAGALLPDRIIHAWSVTDRGGSNGDAFGRAQDRGFFSLSFTARVLASHNVRHEIDLFALSNNVHDVCGAEAVCPEKATLLGPCRVIRQEYPNIRVKSIDLDVSAGEGEPEAAADLVLGEILRGDASPFVAHRRGQRWVQTYEPVALDGPGGAATPFRKGGVYLITGGLGSVGITISEYLARSYGAKLVLVGRASLPPRESWDAWCRSHRDEDPAHARIRALEKIEQLGADTLYMSANVADVDSMRRVVGQAYERFGVLHGVIHGAGLVGDDGYLEIKDTSHEACEGHFQAKARGVLALEAALDGRPLDFCLLLSSLASVLGGIGQAAYAASNIFMDSFAGAHNRSHPVRWLSVNWDVWRVGDQAAAGPRGTLKDLGMSAEEAATVMESALTARTASQLVVSTGDLGARIDQWVKLESLNVQGPAAVAGPARSALSQRPGLRMRYDAPRDETERRIAHIWQDALGIAEVGINDSFADLGGHSLLAVRIVAELRKAFQIDVPLRALFDAPTVAELARHIDARAWLAGSTRPPRAMADNRVEIEL